MHLTFLGLNRLKVILFVPPDALQPPLCGAASRGEPTVRLILDYVNSDISLIIGIFVGCSLVCAQRRGSLQINALAKKE